MVSAIILSFKVFILKAVNIKKRFKGNTIAKDNLSRNAILKSRTIVDNAPTIFKNALS